MVMELQTKARSSHVAATPKFSDESDTSVSHVAFQHAQAFAEHTMSHLSFSSSDSVSSASAAAASAAMSCCGAILFSTAACRACFSSKASFASAYSDDLHMKQRHVISRRLLWEAQTQLADPGCR